MRAFFLSNCRNFNFPAAQCFVLPSVGTILPISYNPYVQTYFGLTLYLLVALALCAVLATLAYLLSLTSSQDAERRSEYECGFAPFDSATRQPFSVHFYLVGILFLVFDVEVALVVPWAVSARACGWAGFWLIAWFIILLTLGFAYEWRRGALAWPGAPAVETQPSEPSLSLGVICLEAMRGQPVEQSAPLLAWLPEIILFIGIVYIFIWMAYWMHDTSPRVRMHFIRSFFVFLLIIVSLFYSLLLALSLDSAPALYGYFYVSQYTVTAKLATAIGGLLMLYCADEYLARHPFSPYEFSLLIAISLLFMLLLTSANHLISAFLCLVGFSLGLYVLILSESHTVAGREAAVKYYLLSSFSSGLIIYGSFILYALVGSGDFDVLQYGTLGLPNNIARQFFLQVGLFIILGGFLFKLSAFPAHLWAADVYEGSAAVITGFFMIPVKLAVASFFIRFLSTALNEYYSLWIGLLFSAAIGSIVWGCLSALQERNFRRFLAYTSINQIGFVLLGLCCNNIGGFNASFFYLLVYALTSATFLSIFVRCYYVNLIERFPRPFMYISDFWGCYPRTLGYVCWTLVLALFSMAGIPPLAGFFSKYILFVELMSSQMYYALIIALSVSLVSAYYYLRIIKVCLFSAPTAGKVHQVVYHSSNLRKWITLLLQGALLSAGFYFAVAMDDGGFLCLGDWFRRLFPNRDTFRFYTPDLSDEAFHGHYDRVAYRKMLWLPVWFFGTLGALLWAAYFGLLNEYLQHIGVYTALCLLCYGIDVGLLWMCAPAKATGAMVPRSEEWDRRYRNNSGRGLALLLFLVWACFIIYPLVIGKGLVVATTALGISAVVIPLIIYMIYRCHNAVG